MGKVYLSETYAGVLQQEPGGRFAFTYDASFPAGKHPAISYTLPLQERPHYSEAGCIHSSRTHVAKLPSGQLPSIIEIEWLSTEVARALLPGQPVVDLEIGPLEKMAPKTLVIRRFDPTPSGRKLHFEKFNQLFGHPSDDKYDGGYEQMAQFIRSKPDGSILIRISDLVLR